jgi:hypothetical protein
MTEINKIEYKFEYNWSLNDFESISSPQMSPSFMVGFNTIGLFYLVPNAFDCNQLITIYLHLTTYDLPILRAKCSLGIIDSNQIVLNLSQFNSIELNRNRYYKLALILRKSLITNPNNCLLIEDNQLKIFCRIHLFEVLKDIQSIESFN